MESRMIGPKYRIATVFGIPINAHISLLLILPLAALRLSSDSAISFGWGLLMAISAFVFIALHELGHSLVAIRKGCRVREITLLLIGGAAQLEKVPTKPKDEILMALAGPAVSVGVGAALLGLSRILPTHAPMYVHFQGLIRNPVELLAWWNFMLAIFNLLPAFPMDGGRVLRAILSVRKGRLAATRIAANIGKFVCILFIALGVSDLSAYWPLVIIGFFIFSAADAEYRTVRREEHLHTRAQDGFGHDQPPRDDEVLVSPPPYSADPVTRVPLQRLRPKSPLDDLLGG